MANPTMESTATPLARHISVGHADLSGNEAKYLVDCVNSGWVSSKGDYVHRFEHEFAHFCGVQEAVSCTSGTAALHLTMVALGLGPGDEVIVPTLTYVATANAVSYCGATPVFVDSDPQTFNLDPADVHRKVTARTRAIIAVHLYGQCADMDALGSIALEREITLIEDAAQAHGATHKGRRAGSMGAAGTFSFFGNKIVTTGEGGMVTLNDRGLAERIRLLQTQGEDPRNHYSHTMIGFNYRMTNLQAAVGVAQMERVAELMAARARVAGWYAAELADLGGQVRGPVSKDGNGHVYWMYAITLDRSVRLSRDEIMARLASDGIETRPVFPPLHLMPPYYRPERVYPVAVALSARGIVLPTHSLMTEEDVSYIGSRLRFHLRGGR
jgi:perosamine synthetase